MADIDTSAGDGINIAALRTERDQLQAEIDAAPAWGAAISVMQERIDGINRFLEGNNHG